MKKRTGIALGILLAVVAWLLLRWVTGRSDPVYDGKPLSVWLRGHVASSAADPPFGSPGWLQAQKVLRSAGTNAIPTLLKMLRAKDPPRVLLNLANLVRRWRPISSRRSASTRHEEAKYAFEVLGTNAAPAVAELIQIYEQGISPSSKDCTAAALGSIGPYARAALPVLLNDFTNTDRWVRFRAVSAVSHIGGDPKLLVPALQSLLKDPMHEIRGNAASALGNFGRRASDAVPALQECIRELAGDETQKAMVEDALWDIAPEKTANALVVEDATPLLAKGVTIENLDASYRGERRTLLDRGTQAPCLAQFWDSEPRGPVILYRSGSTNSETCLGAFEVTSIPLPPTNANASLLCIVADNQMVLCARDNNARRFLEVRRVK